MVATSATRDAANAAEFVRGVTAILGVAPEVLSGDEEARLSFTGATAELAAGPGAPADGREPPPYLVVDIGGGSTEFVLGGGQADAGAPLAALSVDIGCVRLTERHLHGDPPTRAEIAAATTDIDAALDAVAAEVPVAVGPDAGRPGRARSPRWPGSRSGCPATIPARIHHARIPAAQVHEVTRELLAQTREQRAAIGVMHPGRVDVIGAGALVLDRVMARFGFERGRGQRARHPRRHRLVARGGPGDRPPMTARPRGTARLGAAGHRLAGRPGHARDAGRGQTRPRCARSRAARARWPS